MFETWGNMCRPLAQASSRCCRCAPCTVQTPVGLPKSCRLLGQWDSDALLRYIHEEAPAINTGKAKNGRDISGANRKWSHADLLSAALKLGTADAACTGPSAGQEWAGHVVAMVKSVVAKPLAALALVVVATKRVRPGPSTLSGKCSALADELAAAAASGTLGLSDLEGATAVVPRPFLVSSHEQQVFSRPSFTCNDADGHAVVAVHSGRAQRRAGGLTASEKMKMEAHVLAAGPGAKGIVLHVSPPAVPVLVPTGRAPGSWCCSQLIVQSH